MGAGPHGAALLLLLFLSLCCSRPGSAGLGRAGGRAGRAGRARGTRPVTPPGTGPGSRPICRALICLSLLSGPAPALLEPRPYHPTQETGPGSRLWGSFRVAPFQSVGSHLSPAGSLQTAPHPLPPHPRMPGLDPGADTGTSSSLGSKPWDLWLRKASTLIAVRESAQRLR